MAHFPSDQQGPLLRGSRFVTWLERVFGAVLIYFGLNLLFSRK